MMAANALGTAPGESAAGDTALKAARNALALLSLGLVAAVEKRDRANDPPSLPEQQR